MIMLPLLAAAALSPAEMVEHARERIAIAAMIHCPKPVGDEIVVCSRASARDKLMLPLPRELPPGDRRIENALGERAALANMHKWNEPTTVGPGGEYGTTLYMVAQAVGEGTFTPLHKRFEGPDVVYGDAAVPTLTSRR